MYYYLGNMKVVINNFPILPKLRKNGSVMTKIEKKWSVHLRVMEI